LAQRKSRRRRRRRMTSSHDRGVHIMWVRADILCVLIINLHVQLKIFYPRPGLETHTYRALPLPIRQLRSLQCTIPMQIVYKAYQSYTAYCFCMYLLIVLRVVSSLKRRVYTHGYACCVPSKVSRCSRRPSLTF
jgi:hypothetical protein